MITSITNLDFGKTGWYQISDINDDIDSIRFQTRTPERTYMTNEGFYGEFSTRHILRGQGGIGGSRPVTAPIIPTQQRQKQVQQQQARLLRQRQPQESRSGPQTARGDYSFRSGYGPETLDPFRRYPPTARGVGSSSDVVVSSPTSPHSTGGRNNKETEGEAAELDTRCEPDGAEEPGDTLKLSKAMEDSRRLDADLEKEGVPISDLPGSCPPMKRPQHFRCVMQTPHGHRIAAMSQVQRPCTAPVFPLKGQTHRAARAKQTAVTVPCPYAPYETAPDPFTFRSRACEERTPRVTMESRITPRQPPCKEDWQSSRADKIPTPPPCPRPDKAVRVSSKESSRKNSEVDEQMPPLEPPVKSRTVTPSSSKASDASGPRNPSRQASCVSSAVTGKAAKSATTAVRRPANFSWEECMTPESVKKDSVQKKENLNNFVKAVLHENTKLKFKNFNKCFRWLDTDHNGFISRKEFITFFEQFNLPREMAIEYFNKLDKDNNNALDYNECVSYFGSIIIPGYNSAHKRQKAQREKDGSCKWTRNFNSYPFSLRKIG